MRRQKKWEDKHVPNGRIEQSSRKRTKQYEDNLPDAEFKTLIIRKLNKLKGRVKELSEDFNKEIENIKMKTQNIKRNQSEMKNTITEMNILGGINSRLDEAEDRISDLNDKIIAPIRTAVRERI
uniref:t-SNARE coiled-coil homology domain-containing protein n=1 Tax=Rousettus aegyptiacus TaxID=9407 RepID=A0A7J8D777_ROUAE|nr:hypothetical protein HJG63_008894 [Rousettus aegyptiacus]